MILPSEVAGIGGGKGASVLCRPGSSIYRAGQAICSEFTHSKHSFISRYCLLYSRVEMESATEVIVVLGERSVVQSNEVLSSQARNP